MNDMFAGTVFDQDINSWDVSNVTEMNQMFQNSLFNQPLSGWNVSNVTTMVAMFIFSLFDQNIGNWNVSMVNDFTSFMEDKTPSTFSSNNLDSIYNGWSSLPSLQLSLNIKFGDAQYTSSSQSGRDILTNPVISGGYGWNITDGGVI
jgi:surface protein